VILLIAFVDNDEIIAEEFHLFRAVLQLQISSLGHFKIANIVRANLEPVREIASSLAL